MKLWKRASGALKDHKSILRASLTSRSGLQNTNIETTVIKATTHDESRVDYHSIQRVFAWVKISDDSLHHVLWVLFRRMKKTGNWLVTLKGLMLLHGVFCSKVPRIKEIGRFLISMVELAMELERLLKGYTLQGLGYRVNNASHCPNMEQVPEESIREEDIISGIS
ncbi:putative clathrin assembly protein [Tanacetum coccineum]